MNRTKIEWVKNPDGTPGYTWNPIVGCLNHTNGMCKGGNFPCYAYRLAHTRLKERYLANVFLPELYGNDLIFDKAAKEVAYDEHRNDPFYPRFWDNRLGQPIEKPSWSRPIKPKGIFVCVMSDLFGIGIPNEWTEQVLTTIKLTPWNRYYLLTKQPQNLIKFSPFPDNCWVGVTATNYQKASDACGWLDNVNAKVKYISIEPLLSWNESINTSAFVNWISDINWIIIGAVTGTEQELSCLKASAALTLMPYGKKWTLQPKIEWVKEIVKAADEAGISVFLKNNMRPLLVTKERDSETMPAWAGLRQELPK